MPEDLRSISRAPQQPSPTVRDLAAVLFRQKRVALTTFVLVFSAVLIYGLVFPPYQAEMKILLRHSRVDPVVAAIPSQPEFERQAVTEEEVNSETELLQDEEILRTVIQKAGLISEGHSWFWSLVGDNPDRQLARAVRRIGKRLTIEPAHKAALITATYDSSDREQGQKLLRALGSAYVERHSDLEGLSLALLDAMGSGVCVLTSDIPENREVVQDAGFTFRAGDRDDLARMLALLVSDPETRAAAGRMEKQIIQSRYLWPHIAGQISAVYQELMGTKGVCDHVASVSLESKAEETERVV